MDPRSVSVFRVPTCAPVPKVKKSYSQRDYREAFYKSFDPQPQLKRHSSEPPQSIYKSKKKFASSSDNTKDTGTPGNGTSLKLVQEAANIPVSSAHATNIKSRPSGNHVQPPVQGNKSIGSQQQQLTLLFSVSLPSSSKKLLELPVSLASILSPADSREPDVKSVLSALSTFDSQEVTTKVVSVTRPLHALVNETNSDSAMKSVKNTSANSLAGIPDHSLKTNSPNHPLDTRLLDSPMKTDLLDFSLKTGLPNCPLETALPDKILDTRKGKESGCKQVRLVLSCQPSQSEVLLIRDLEEFARTHSCEVKVDDRNVVLDNTLSNCHVLDRAVCHSVIHPCMPDKITTLNHSCSCHSLEQAAVHSTVNQCLPKKITTLDHSCHCHAKDQAFVCTVVNQHMPRKITAVHHLCHCHVKDQAAICTVVNQHMPGKITAMHHSCNCHAFDQASVCTAAKCTPEKITGNHPSNCHASDQAAVHTAANKCTPEKVTAVDHPGKYHAPYQAIDSTTTNQHINNKLPDVDHSNKQYAFSKTALRTATIQCNPKHVGAVDQRSNHCAPDQEAACIAVTNNKFKPKKNIPVVTNESRCTYVIEVPGDKAANLEKDSAKHIVKQKETKRTEKYVKQKETKCMEKDIKQKETKCMEKDVKQKATKCMEKVFKQKETKCTEKDVKQKETKCTEKDVKQEETKCTEKDVKQKETKLMEKDVKQKETKFTEKDVKQKETKFTEKDVKQKETKFTEKDVKQKETKCTEKDMPSFTEEDRRLHRHMEEMLRSFGTTITTILNEL